MNRPRVLIADDNQAILDRVARQLNNDFEIIATSTDGQAALEAILLLKPDAVVLDISMPCMTGLELASRLSQLPDRPRIVFLTAHEDQDFVDEAERVGGSGYVLKRNLCTQLAPALLQALVA